MLLNLWQVGTSRYTFMDTNNAGATRNIVQAISLYSTLAVVFFCKSKGIQFPISQYNGANGIIPAKNKLG